MRLLGVNFGLRVSGGFRVEPNKNKGSEELLSVFPLWSLLL